MFYYFLTVYTFIYVQIHLCCFDNLQYYKIMVGSNTCKILVVFYFLTVDSQKSGSKVLSKLIPTIYGSHSTDCGQVPTFPPVRAQHHAGWAWPLGPWDGAGSCLKPHPTLAEHA